MSKPINMDVQAVLNTEDLYSQISQIRPRITVDVDTSHISRQIQAAVAQASASAVPVSIPVPVTTPGSIGTSPQPSAVLSSGNAQLEEQSSGLQNVASAGMGALNTVSQLVTGYTALQRIGKRLHLPSFSESLD